MIEKIKTLLGMSSGAYDEVICDSIEEARAELIRAGVSRSMAEAEEPDPLIRKAIVTYACAQHAISGVEIERYEAAFRYQMDNIRKTPAYME